MKSGEHCLDVSLNIFKETIILTVMEVLSWPSIAEMLAKVSRNVNEAA